MELIEEFEGCMDIIKMIREFLYADFLINDYEIQKFIAMYSKYKDTSFRSTRQVQSEYLSGIVCDSYFIYDDNGEIKEIKDVKYNLKDWTVDYVGNGTYEKINFSTEISNFKLRLKLDKEQNMYLITVLENILLSDDDSIGKIFEMVIRKKVYPLNLNAVLECAPYTFISKYYDRFFPNTHFKSNVTTHNITINNTYNDIKCLIPRNLFETYCKFDNLNKDFPNDSDEFTIPIMFNKLSSNFFIECILAGQLLELPHTMTESDFLEFKSMISYLDVNLFDAGSNNYH